MATVYRPCYCSREDVRRAQELRQAAYDNDRIDRAIIAAAEAIEGLTQRRFYTEFTTRKWDWPNWQYAPPWKLYLEQNELAAAPTLVTAGSLMPNPVVITSDQYILHPQNDSPPYTRLELRRDLNVSFGYNPTPQLDIAITGPFGYWMKQRSAGLVAVECAAVDNTITVTDSSKIGVGDVLIAGSERMLVTEATYVDSGVNFSGLTEAKASDKIVAVGDGTKFNIGEVLLADFEWLLIELIVGNNLFVRRAWDGSLLSEHHSGTLWVRRKLDVLRGQLGTTAVLHTAASALAVAEVPGLIRELSIAEAEVWLTQEHGAYGGASAQTAGGGGGPSSEPVAGPGLPDIRNRVACSKFTRKARTRVVLWLLG